MWPEYSPKQINVTDRATILNFIVGLNGYTVCTGIDNEDLNNEKIITIPLDTDKTMLLGWITNERANLSNAAQLYLAKLREVIKEQGYTLIDSGDSKSGKGDGAGAGSGAGDRDGAASVGKTPTATRGSAKSRTDVAK